MLVPVRERLMTFSKGQLGYIQRIVIISYCSSIICRLYKGCIPVNINDWVSLIGGALLVGRRRGGKDGLEVVVVVARGRFNGD